MTESRTEHQVSDADKSVTQLREEYLKLVTDVAAAQIRIAQIELELNIRAFTE